MSRNAYDAAAIFRKLEALPEFARAETVLAFMSLPDEVETHEKVASWSRSKRVALPLVVGDRLHLKLYEAGKMVSGYMGILEPSADAVDVRPEEIDLAIVPGVAFDRRGYRLGRGKGFYDRLLPDLACPKIGIAQSFRLMDEIPLDPWDCRLDLIIADNE